LGPILTGQEIPAVCGLKGLLHC